jgi:hypothetical protein
VRKLLEAGRDLTPQPRGGKVKRLPEVGGDEASQPRKAKKRCMNIGKGEHAVPTKL